ncbi:MAG: VgrG-related protein, partial [Anaerolineae bacterium]|nr:VgrG-related protein [Anaerolineae bacterium]
MPAEPRLMDHFFIKVDGNDVATEVMDDLIEVTVDTSLHLPDAVTIHIHDERLRWIDEGPFVLGKEIEVSAQPEGGGTSQVIFRGEITSLEPDFGEGTQATLLVRAYDRSHRLHRGTHSQAYLDVTDSDLASRIANEAGLRTQVDDTSEVYPYVLQHNQTHMEFLSERARRIGYEFFVEDRTLYFRRPPRDSAALQLEWGNQLRSFRPRLSLVEQVDEVIVKGWDPKARQAITGQAQRGQAAPQIGERESGQQIASSAFSAARRVVVDVAVSSQAEADTVAQAILDEISGAYIEADGVCYGQPQLRAGRAVEIRALGRRLSGTYMVTEATHIYRKDGGYLTRFSIHGRRPATLAALLEPDRRNGQGAHGPVIGIVTSNNDPKGWGRVKVQFPWLPDNVESTWARLASPGAGPDRGIYWLP